MGRRVGVVGADHALDLGQDASGFFLRFGNDRQRANAFAIQRQRFGERARGEEGQARLGEQAHCQRIFLDSLTEALVGHVQKRYVALGLDHFQHFFPVIQAQVDAGRVVAAGVQHDHRVVRQVVQVFEHAGTVHVVGGSVVVAIVLHRKACGFEQRAMVFPARIADGDDGIGQQLLEEVGTDLQCAGAADRLGGQHAARGDQRRIGAQQQFLHGLVIGSNTVDRQVATRSMLGHADLLGFGHGAQQGNAPVFITVDAYAKVDLGAAGVGVEGFVDTQDRIAGCHFDSGKQAHGAAALGEEWEGDTLRLDAPKRCANRA